MLEPAVVVISPKSMVRLADWLSATIAVVNLTSRQSWSIGKYVKKYLLRSARHLIFKSIARQQMQQAKASRKIPTLRKWNKNRLKKWSSKRSPQARFLNGNCKVCSWGKVLALDQLLQLVGRVAWVQSKFRRRRRTTACYASIVVVNLMRMRGLVT